MARLNPWLKAMDKRAAEQRKALRRSRPEIDAALVKWFDFTPITASGVRAEKTGLEAEPVGAR